MGEHVACQRRSSAFGSVHLSGNAQVGTPATPGPDLQTAEKSAREASAPAQRNYFRRPAFLRIDSQSLVRPFMASSAVPLLATTYGCQRLLAVVNSSAYWGTAQKSFTICMDW